MVATVNDVVKTLLGEYYDISPTDISSKEWVRLLRAVLTKIDLTQLEKFANIRRLYSREQGLTRTIPVDVFREKKDMTMALFRLADIVPPPHDPQSFELRTVDDHHDKLPLQHSAILMSRKGTCFFLRATWTYQVEYDRNDEIKRSWTQVERLWLAQADDNWLARLVADNPKLPGRIFQSLLIGVEETNSKLDSALRHGVRTRDQIERIARVTWRTPD